MDSVLLATALTEISQMISSDQFEAASSKLQETVLKHPDWIDERFQAEVQMIMKQMEYKLALKDFNYLRSLAVAYHYLELNYGRTYFEEQDLPKQTVVEGRDEMEQNNESDREMTLPDANTIWWCWLQGLENAPEIIKSCYRSLERQLEGTGKKIVVLNQKNLHDYISLPDFIERKYRDGQIGMAHYADLVRLELLTKRGGTWIDATTYLTGKLQLLPLLEEDLFFYRAGSVSEYLIFDNWFMHARKESGILQATKELLYRYWKKESEAKHYFIFQLMMTYVCQHFHGEFKKIPLYSNEPCHVLQRELGNPFTERRWKQIIGMSDVHKLTYRIEGTLQEHSFYEWLLGHKV